ncbi:uncharacterized protein IUM83_13919 [Phytophthora cinnamomi]|uniref:uncharacterized protein n=1 Tax=Phytophthora cinnamomi TaxID=4785 RepID=UPI0035599096|nr:hypothetical protein IUM83_13919 [Phytophthora cinnamomi]
MAEAEATRKVRSGNAQLMEANLSLLMEIRETDTEIDAERRKLRAKCQEMQKRGISVPGNFAELLAENQQGNPRPTPATGEQK